MNERRGPADQDPLAAPEQPVPGAVESAAQEGLEEPAPSAAPPLQHAEETTIYQSYEQRARLAEDRLSEVLGAYRALKAETEGHRERITKNLDRRFDQRRERLLLKFIEILDNLDRALEAAEATSAGESLIEGLILVRTQLLQTLKEEGLERIPALGHPYDPHVAEGVDTRVVDDPERHHVVVKELQRGYLLNGRVARPARVIVGEYVSPDAEREPSLAEAAAAAAAAVEPAPTETRLELQDPDLELPEPDLDLPEPPDLELTEPDLELPEPELELAEPALELTDPDLEPPVFPPPDPEVDPAADALSALEALEMIDPDDAKPPSGDE